MAQLFEKFKRDIAGVFLSAVAILVGLSLASYHPADPSLNTVSAEGTAKVIANLCGYFGSFLSDILYQMFGLASWLIVLVAAHGAYKTFAGLGVKWTWRRASLASLLVLVIASLGGLYFPNTRLFQNQIAVGGLLGLLTSRGLVAVFNTVGVGVILWASALVLTVFLTEKRLTEILPFRQKRVPATVRRGPGLFARVCASFKSFFEGDTEDKPLNKDTGLQGPTALRTDAAAQELAQEVTPEEVQTGFAQKVLNLVLEKNDGDHRGVQRAGFSIVKPFAQKKKSGSKAPIQIENWELPPVDLLADPPSDRRRIDEREINRNARLVEQKLGEFEVTGQVVEVKPGPAVTMYEFRPAASVKITEITKLADDLSLALSAESLRIIAPIPGRDVVGIETSNSKRDNIYMKELVEAPDFWNTEMKLPIALGKNVSGEPKIVDLRRIPHLLVAGTTGSGKSVFVMSLVTSLVMRHSPKTLRLVIIDPKQVDLAAFHKLPHLLLPAVKEARPAVNTLKWLIREMEKRYRSMSRFNAKNIELFNDAVTALKAEDRQKHEENVRNLEAVPQTATQSYYTTPQPYIVAVVEEFADLMSVDRNGVEPAVVRLAQMARASGIHLVLAMQSPRREVLTGLIKTNFPGRICFKVASKVDSSIVIDQRGAERLLSVGDMLYLAPGVSQPQRYHGAYLSEDEINSVTQFWEKQGEPVYNELAVKVVENADSGGNDPFDDDGEMGMEYDQVVAFVTSQKEVSASLLQRRFRFGYPKAARIIETLESEGVVGPSNGSKPRQVLANRLD